MIFIYLIIYIYTNKYINKIKMKMKKIDIETFKKIYNDKYDYEKNNCINICEYIKNIFNELNTNKYNTMEKLNDFLQFNHFNIFFKHKNNIINDKLINTLCYHKQFYNALSDKIDFVVSILLKYECETNKLICCEYTIQKTCIELYSDKQLKNMIL